MVGIAGGAGRAAGGRGGSGGVVMRGAVDTAKAQVDVAVQQYNANQAMIRNTDLEQQPAVKQSAAELRDAWLALQRTDIRSPMDGYISRRSVQVGSQISTSTPLLAVVPDRKAHV